MKWNHKKCDEGRGNPDGEKNVPVGSLLIYDNPPMVQAVRQPTKCGCEVVGNGTIPHPLTVKFCKRHK